LEKDTRIIIALTPVSPSRPKPLGINKPQLSNFNTSRPVAHSSLNLYGSNHNIGGGFLLSPANNTTKTFLESERISNVPKMSIHGGNFFKHLKNDNKIN
jgi:hypothetical protein